MHNIGANAYSSGQMNSYKTQGTIKESYTNNMDREGYVAGFGASTGQGMYEEPVVDLLSDS